MNIPIDMYLGIVNPLLIITNLQVDLDITQSQGYIHYVARRAEL